MIPPQRAHEGIAAAAERAMAKIGHIEPYRLDKPYRMVTRWHKEEHAAQDANRPGARLVDPFTVEAVVDRL